MEWGIVALVAIPFAIPAGAGLAMGARNAGVRVFGLLCALAATATIGFVVGEGMALDAAIELCSDESASYFQFHGRFAPFCRGTP